MDPENTPSVDGITPSPSEEESAPDPLKKEKKEGSEWVTWQWLPVEEEGAVGA